jgi:ribosome biogenesis GTPase A
MSLIDTPGMLWPNLSQADAFKLAATHSIGRSAYEDEDVALELGRWLLEAYPQQLAERFGELPAGCDGSALLQLVAQRRNLIKSAGLPDLAKAAQALLNDFRAGVLGRITLDLVHQDAREGSRP